MNFFDRFGLSFTSHQITQDFLGGGGHHFLDATAFDDLFVIFFAKSNMTISFLD